MLLKFEEKRSNSQDFQVIKTSTYVFFYL